MVKILCDHSWGRHCDAPHRRRTIGYLSWSGEFKTTRGFSVVAEACPHWLATRCPIRRACWARHLSLLSSACAVAINNDYSFVCSCSWTLLQQFHPTHPPWRHLGCQPVHVILPYHYFRPHLSSIRNKSLYIMSCVLLRGTMCYCSPHYLLLVICLSVLCVVMGCM